MQIAKKLILASLCLASFASTGLAQNQTRDGALMGGVAGALLGGVIGKQNNETTEGALIGGAVGALAGGVYGNHRQQLAQQQYYAAPPQYPTYYTQTTYVPVQQVPVQTTRVVTRRPVTTAEVINMVRSGVSDAVIVAHIQTNGVAMRPDVNDVILMNQEGVSDYVVTMMQQTSSGYRPAPTTYRTYQQPVVVQEKVIVHPTPVYHTRPVYSRPYYAERRGF